MKDKIFKVVKNHIENEETTVQLTNELCVLLGVIPREIPYKLYLEIEEKKCERYGGVFSEISKQAEYSHGQCDTIDTIEDWLKTL